ncbi:Catalase [Enterobacter hormaechei]|nr:Catalase [Enterobacter hormaechei]
MRTYIRERVVDHLAHIDIQLAQGVANNLASRSPMSNAMPHRQKT